MMLFMEFVDVEIKEVDGKCCRCKMGRGGTYVRSSEEEKKRRKAGRRSSNK